MSSGAEDCLASCCGCCTLALCGAWASWCNMRPYGSGRGSQAGCCGSCCDKSFDEDAFEAQVKRDMEKTRDPNAQMPNSTRQQQMAPTQEMATKNNS